MTVFKESGAGEHYLGLSSDAKPTTGLHPGATFQEVDTSVQSIYDGTTWWRTAVAQGYSLIKITEITSGTTYSPTTGARALRVRCLGGGGAGGSAATAVTNAGAAGGGGAGGYSESWLTNLHASPYTVAVGAAGAAAAAGAHDGGNGGDTTFDSPAVITAKGGAGGKQKAVTVGPVMGGLGGAGGAASAGAGDIKVDGAAGYAGIMLAAAQAVSGSGAPSVLGGGGQGRITQGDGAAAATYGAGGAGGCIVSGGTDQAGGNGSAGIIIVEEYA